MPLTKTLSAIAGLLVVLGMACKADNPPHIDDLSLAPQTGAPGTSVRIRIVATDSDGTALTAWVMKRKDTGTPDLGRVDLPAVTDTTGVYAGTWSADTSGLNGHPDGVWFEGHVSDGKEERHGFLTHFAFTY